MQIRGLLTRNKCLLASCICLVIGASIYFIFRDDVVFIRFFNLKTQVHECYDDSIIIAFVRYNLSDALWALSLMLFLSFQGTRGVRIVGLLVPVIMECLQLIKFFPGTFDLVDLSVYVVITVIFFVKWKVRNEL